MHIRMHAHVHICREKERGGGEMEERNRMKLCMSLLKATYF